MDEWDDIIQAVGEHGQAALRGIRRDRDGALILGGIGGAIGFFVAGPVGAVKGALIGARLVGAGKPSSPTAENPVTLREEMTPPLKAASSEATGEPARDIPLAARAPVAWIASKEKLRPEYAKAHPWVIEAEGLKFGLIPGRPYSVGRDDACDIRVQETAYKGGTVSRKHASLLVFDDGLYVIDEQSRNGTFVNGTKVPPGTASVMRKPFYLHLGKFAIFVAPV